MSKSLKYIRFISYLAMYSAMYIILKYVATFIPFLVMPNGGMIEMELIAVMLASYHLGWKGGAMVALLSWLVTIVLGFPMYFVNPIQVLLDYVLPLLVCGLASVLWPFKTLNRRAAMIAGIIVAASAVAGVLLCYPVSVLTVAAAIAIGVLAGVFIWWYASSQKPFGIIISMVLKYLFTVISGAYFWAEGAAAGSNAAWLFSLNYNLGYNLVTMVVCIIAVPVLFDRVVRKFTN